MNNYYLLTLLTPTHPHSPPSPSSPSAPRHGVHRVGPAGFGMPWGWHIYIYIYIYVYDTFSPPEVLRCSWPDSRRRRARASSSACWRPRASRTGQGSWRPPAKGPRGPAGWATTFRTWRSLGFIYFTQKYIKSYHIWAGAPGCSRGIVGGRRTAADSSLALKRRASETAGARSGLVRKTGGACARHRGRS